MARRINRRQALAGMGSVSLGALLAACGSDDDSTTTSVATTEGEATVQSRTGSNLAELFDDTSACTLTAEQTEGPYYFDVDKSRSGTRTPAGSTRGSTRAPARSSCAGPR